MKETVTIVRRALRVDQTPNIPLYLFTLTGEELLRIAVISRISRDDVGRLIGYQRPEVRSHVQQIVEYLNSDSVIFPSTIVLALTSSVRFHSSRGPKTSDGLSTSGSLEIPIDSDGLQKPAWIVDGQQRALAISMSNRPDLAVPVSAFVADDVEVQRDQFIRVNNTRPLPRALITELLPEVSFSLPSRLAARKLPSALCDVLNSSPESPFVGLIRRASTSADKRKDAVVADTSIVKMIEDSLSNPSGCLFPYRNLATGETDTEGLARVLLCYWTAVKHVFPEAWGLPPTRSRLMHGCGIRAMGRLMDKVMASHTFSSTDPMFMVEADLELVAPYCHWTSGVWEEMGGLGWNELQNVPRHIRLLSSFLIRTYLRAKSAA